MTELVLGMLARDTPSSDPHERHAWIWFISRGQETQHRGQNDEEAILSTNLL